MPIFEYLCQKCGSKQDLLRSYAASHEVTCDICSIKGERVYMEKQVSSTGTFRFKTENGGSSSTYAVGKTKC